jgi:hypothetical protein
VLELIFDCLNFIIFISKTDGEMADENMTKAFFKTYARAKGFDALLPDNWYSQQFSKILSYKVVN